MITEAELSRIELFSGMTSEQLRHFSTKAADVWLEPQEILVRDGERSGFYVVLEGRLQVSKVVHGTQHDFRQCGPGDFFGELPNLLGMTSGVFVRAYVRCRVARFDLQQLQELIQESVPSSGLILRRMSQRVLDSQRFAQTVPSVRVAVATAKDSLDHHRMRAFLTANRIPYTWQQRSIEADSRPCDDMLMTIDESITLTNPTLRDLATALGFQTAPRHNDYDVVIVGAGPAGMAAGLYAASEGLHTILVEREAAGGQAGTSSRIENYLGFPSGVSGDDLSERALSQALRFGAEIAMTRSVVALELKPGGFRVSLDGLESIFSRSVVIASGVDWRRLDVPGINDLLGRGVLYGASRTEAMSTNGKKVFIVGGGNSAGQAAMFFADYAQDVRLLVRGLGLAASMSQYLINQLSTRKNIAIETQTRVTGVQGEGALRQVLTVTDKPGELNHEQARQADALFLMIGAEAHTEWLPAELERDARGFLLTGRDLNELDGTRVPFPLETNVPGIFCAGDVRHGSVKRVASGVGEGSMVIAFIHQYLRDLFARYPRSSQASATLRSRHSGNWCKDGVGEIYYSGGKT